MIGLFLPERRTHEDFGPTADFWYGPVARKTSSGVAVTNDEAMTYSAVWACTRLLSATAGRLPLNLYRRSTDRGKAIAKSDSRDRLVYRQPNRNSTPMLFKSQGFIQQINGGNSVAEIQWSADRRDPVAFWPIHNSRVKPVIDEKTGDLYYRVRNNNGPDVDIHSRDILHFPSMISDDGIWGKGVIDHARESIGMGIATERHGASTFGHGGIPRVVVETPKKWTDVSRQNFRKEWKEIYGGPDGERIGTIDDGAKLHVMNIDHEALQFLTTRQHNIEEIARWYGVPPHKIQHLLRATFSNIEHQSIEFITDSLMPWLVIWEEELDRKLLSEAEQEDMFFAFNANEYMRGDTVARGQYWQSMVTSGIAQRNEARVEEDMNPVEGGNTFLVQGGMVALDKEGKPTAFGGEGGGETVSDNNDDPTASDAESAANAGNVQSTALNGAQIVALVDIANRLATEQLPPEGTRALIQAAFPLMPQSLIDKMVSELDKFTPKPQEPEEQDDAAAQNNKPTDESLAAAKDVVRIVLQETIARMIRKEATAARRAANKPGEFMKWMDEFYAKHQEQVTEALTFAEHALLKLSLAFSAEHSAAWIVEQSKSALLKASETTADKFAKNVDQLMTEWETNRAAAIVREFFERVGS